jgi:hypothetical protein
MAAVGGVAASGMRPPALRLVVGGAYDQCVPADSADVRQTLQETLLFLRGQHAHLREIPGGSLYATAVGTWIRFLEASLRRLR